MQIYMIYNHKTGKSYIGKSINYEKRFQKHIRNAIKKINRRLYDSMNYHGYDNFELILIENLDEFDNDHVNERERYWIDYFDTLMPNGYNMTIGGDGGYTLEKWSDKEKKELYQRQKDARSWYTSSERHKEVVRNSNKNRTYLPMSEEQKTKIRETNKRKGIQPPDHFKWKKGQVGTFLGKKHREESKRKMSENSENRKWSGDGVKDRKEAYRQKFIGENNINFVEFPTILKIDIVNYILSTYKANLGYISETYEISLYKIRTWLKEYGIDNYQQLCYKFNHETWVYFWEDILCLLKSSKEQI